MTTQQQREAFERCHVVPQDASYNATFCEYRYTENFGVTHPFNELFESFCDGARWQAAQQVQGEVDLPREERKRVISNWVTGAVEDTRSNNKYPPGPEGEGFSHALDLIEAKVEYFEPHPAQHIPKNLRLIFELGAQMGGGAKLTQEQCKAMLAATPQPAQQVPKGWKIVPPEPTEEMLTAFFTSGPEGLTAQEWDDADSEDVEFGRTQLMASYSAMLDAALPTPTQEQ